jgi:hypothetical protein
MGLEAPVLPSTHDFKQDFGFSELAEKCWVEWFAWRWPKAFASITKIPREKQVEGDIRLVMQTGPVRQTVINVELKTRKPSFLSKFLKDERIFIETESNVELNGNSSSIFHSQADIWAYGFADSYEKPTTIQYPSLYKRAKLANHLKEYGHLYERVESLPTIVNAEKKYHSAGLLVKTRPIERYRIKPRMGSPEGVLLAAIKGKKVQSLERKRKGAERSTTTICHSG